MRAHFSALPHKLPISTTGLKSSRSCPSSFASYRRLHIAARPSRWNRNPIDGGCRRGVSTVGSGPFETVSNFGPFVPPDPKKLPKPRPPNQYLWVRKHGRRLLIATAIGGTLYFIDNQFNYSTITRTLRTFYTGLYLTIDYKWHFNAAHGDSISALHERSANRVFDLLSANGGLYLKIGQAIAMQNAVLPPAWQQKFAKLFDEAPQASWNQIEKMMKEEYGPAWRNIFMEGEFEEKAIGSASIAQVHKARLKTGELVAVKIQKPQIAKWVKWDLWAWGVLMYLQSKIFDLPFYFLVPFISQRLMSEADFLIEQDNATLMAKLVESDPKLRDRVYIPKVYTQYSTKRILVMEFIDNACKLWDRDLLSGPYRGDDMIGKEIGRRRAPAPPKSIRSDGNTSLTDAGETPLFDSPVPTTNRKPRVRVAGYGLSLYDVMSSMIDLFGTQIYIWGHVHADPHPANCLVRRQKNGKPQFVLIDHGLYVHMTPELRRTYSEFWMALLTFDNDAITKIAESWGFGDGELLASATLLRPYSGGESAKGMPSGGDNATTVPKETEYSVHMKVQDQIKSFLKETPKMPKELVFIGRAMRILQGCNQHLGSPVNRIKRLSLFASSGFLRGENMGWKQRMVNLWHYAVFRFMIFSMDFAFVVTNVRRAIWGGEGFEDMIERQMIAVAKDFGVELQPDRLFEG